ncbi:MAG TPA: ABC transporter permease [Gemmatimonadaceae bacterium]|nr:ABC transporter permease [Gemmatimonadaceae bacterium]
MPVLRSLSRKPGYSILAILTIAIGVGGVGAVASVINGVLLRPLPFRDAQQLVTIDVTSSQGFGVSTSIPNYNDWRDRSRVFQAYGATASWGFRVTGTAASEIVDAEAVYGDFFKALGIEPQLGRLFDADEALPGSPGLAVLTHHYWQRRFNGRRDIVGTSLGLDGQPYTIVGVLPEDVRWPQTDLLANMGSIPDLPWDDRNSSFGTRIYARLADGVSLGAAQADVARAGREVRQQYGANVATPSVRPLQEYLIGSAAGQLLLLMAAVTLVLLVAMANVGGLLFARAEERRRELATRMALGASQRDVVAQLVSESVILALIGGTLGILLGVALLRPLVTLLPTEIAPVLRERVSMDPVTILVTLGVALLTAVAFGALPALRTVRVDLHEALSAGIRVGGTLRERTRATFVVAEVALSALVLIGAGLLLASFLELQRTDKGFASDARITARVSATSGEFPEKARWIGFYDEVLGRTRALPGVSSAAVSLLVPLTQRSWELRTLPDGGGDLQQNGASTLFNIVSEDYFTTFGVPLIAGRAFASTDRDGTLPVAIIDSTMAERYWPGTSAIGKRLTVGERAADSGLVYRTVVGVVRNVRHYQVHTPSRIQIYIPFHQTLARSGFPLNVTLKTSLPTPTVIESLRRTVSSIDSRIPVSGTSTLDAYVDAALSGERALGTIVGWLAVVALLVTAVGLVGIVSYTVIQRTREIAIRMALGARGGSVVGWITSQGLRLALIGLAIGMVAALALGRVLARFLYGVSPTSPTIYAVCAVVILAVATIAALVPARRAARVNATLVLRGD